MGFNKMVKCGSCGFGNREGDDRCLFCQAPLTEEGRAAPRKRRAARAARPPGKTPVMPSRARPPREPELDPSRRRTAKHRSLSDITGRAARPKITRVPSDNEVLIPRPEIEAEDRGEAIPALSGDAGPKPADGLPVTELALDAPKPEDLAGDNDAPPAALSPEAAEATDQDAEPANPWMSRLEEKEAANGADPKSSQSWGGPSTVMSDSGSWRKKTDMHVPVPSFSDLTSGGEDARDATPRPQRGEGSRRLERGAGRLLGWLVCEQLDPIPVGYAREVRIGRHQENDLVLPHKEVSRFHAALRVSSDETLTILDLGSSNGLTVNDKASKEAAVAIDDVITIGPYRLQIRDKNNTGHHSSLEDDDAEKTIATMAQAHADGNAALSGNLVDTPLSELLQGMEFHQKTGVLTVNCPGGAGRVAVREGQPHSAAVGSLAGKDAMFAMLRFKGGTFTLVSTEPPEERELGGTITGLLLEFSRESDEGSKGRAEPPPDDFGGATMISAEPEDEDRGAET